MFVLSWLFASIKGKYIPECFYAHMKEIFKKRFGIGRGRWGYIPVLIILSWLIMIYQRVISNVKNVQDNCGMIWRKIKLLKEIYLLVQWLKTIGNELGDWILGFCNNFVGKIAG